MEENKDKRRSPQNQSPDDTVVFKRAPSVKQSSDGTPSVTSRPRTPESMQHTAKIQGGAVIRPLKQTPGNPPQQNPSAPKKPPAQAPAAQNPPRPYPTRQYPVTQNPAVGAGQPNPRPALPQQTSRPTGGKLPQTASRPGTSQNPPVRKPTSGTVRPASTAQPSTPRTPVPASKSQTKSPAPAQPVTSVRSENDDFEIDEITFTGGIPKVPRKQDSYAADSAISAIMSLVKAVVYIVAIIAVSVALSVFVINTANDVFKFVGEDKIIAVEIPEYATVEQISDILGEAGVIKYPWAFTLWGNLKEKGVNPPKFVAGTYEVSTMLNYDYLRSAFKKKTVRTEVRITIPEGYTVDEIIDLFVEENNIGTREGFVDAINNYDFDYRFLENLTVSPDRLYRLEGYLFPDTYYFYSDSSEVAVLTKLLDNFERKFIDEYYDRCQDLGMTVDEAIILASMVEKEARYADEMGNISSVFHNRLKYKSTFPWLQSDATIMYAIQHDTGSRLDVMTGEDTEYDTPYNTYKHKGLPPGPIANPGLNAIVYALYPSDTEYFYFVANSSGRSLFAKTGPEHEKNIIIARSGG